MSYISQGMVAMLFTFDKLCSTRAGCCVAFVNMSHLSLVAEFDDLVRSRAVLSVGIETG